MTSLTTMLENRVEEFNTHFTLAVSLDSKIFEGEDISIGSTQLSVRHLLTMKSGLIVHLYNVLESVMSQATKKVGAAVGTVPPKNWSEKARREWLREHGVKRIEGDADKRLRQIESFSINLLKDGPLGPQVIGKPPGTWTNETICQFADRLGVRLSIDPKLNQRLAKKAHFGDLGPIVFLAKRRNDLAHGDRTFEDGVSTLTLKQIREIADVTFDFVGLVATSFEHYVEHKQFVITA